MPHAARQVEHNDFVNTATRSLNAAGRSIGWPSPCVRHLLRLSGKATRTNQLEMATPFGTMITIDASREAHLYQRHYKQIPDWVTHYEHRVAAHLLTISATSTG